MIRGLKLRPVGNLSRREAGNAIPAKALHRKGGLTGGKARAKALSPEQRREIALEAAAARWRKT